VDAVAADLYPVPGAVWKPVGRSRNVSTIRFGSELDADKPGTTATARITTAEAARIAFIPFVYSLDR
jgi:hypothetical protein